MFAVLLIIPRSQQRLALVDRLTKRLSLPTDTDDIILNFVAMNRSHKKEMDSDSIKRDAVGKISKSKSLITFCV